MASGGMRMARGSYVGTGAAIEIAVDEKPLHVELLNMTDPALGKHHDQMAAASLLVITDSCLAVTSNGVTLKSLGDGDSFTGFEVGTDANFNTSGETVYWTAWYL